MTQKTKDTVEAWIVVDQKGLIVKINSAAEQLFGYQAKEVLGQKSSVLLPPSSVHRASKGLVFELLENHLDAGSKKGLKKEGVLFPVDVFVIPFSDQKKRYYHCIIKDDSIRFYHERMEMLANVVLRRVLMGEKLDHFAPFVLDHLNQLFSFPLMWIGQYDKNEQGVLIISSIGPQSHMAPAKTFYTKHQKAVHPAVYACERMETLGDDLVDENGQPHRLVAFPFLSKRVVGGVLAVLAPVCQLAPVVLNRLESIALRLGMLLQISADQNLLRLLGTALATAMNAVIVTDDQYKILWVNESFSKLTGYASEDAVGQTTAILSSGIQPPEIFRHMESVIRAGKPWRGEVTDRHKNGSLFTTDEMVTPILDHEGRITHFVFVLNDLTARKDAEGRIQSLSNYDQLTGLPNRHSFRESLKQILSRAAHQSELVGLICLDLAAFNRINDTMGHRVGDRILKLAGVRILSAVSSKDVVARIDGDEYAVILPDLERPEEAGEVAYEIIRLIQEPFEIDGTEVNLGAYAGITIYPSDTTDADKLINYADMALFKSKKEGVNTYSFFSPELNAEIEGWLKMERDMKKALQRADEFVLHYQPQINLETGQVTGFEALVRWNHPARGMIYPNVFIPVAEDTHLIMPLSMLVLKKALEQLKEWDKLGFKNLSMGVNLSPCQFGDKTLLPGIRNILAQTKVKAGRLEFELTESIMMKDAQETVCILDELLGLGVRVAIDDFGTGYSSLSYLRCFPVDRLKIDRSFIKDMESAKESAGIVRAIIHIGHVLGMDVVAEGVENETELDLLQEMGCDGAQGFYIGKPMSAKDATEFLKKRS